MGSNGRKESAYPEDVKRFLGVERDEDVDVLKGQEASAAKLKEAQSTYLLQEACEFGDALVRYVINHHKLTLEQRAWAVTLGALCARQDYPEGVATFDELAAQGASDLDLEVWEPAASGEAGGEAGGEASGEASGEATTEKSLFASDTGAFVDAELAAKAAEFAELFAKYIAHLKRSMGISNPQVIYGIGRAFHNLRATFPAVYDGADGFDRCARHAGHYFARG